MYSCILLIELYYTIETEVMTVLLNAYTSFTMPLKVQGRNLRVLIFNNLLRIGYMVKSRSRLRSRHLTP